MAIDQYDIYLSYAPEDIDRVRRIVEELEWAGLKVWYRDQPASPAESQAMLRQFLGPNTCHVVVWTKDSAASGRIQAEARTGAVSRRLIATRLDGGIIPPKGTDAYAYADLADWSGGSDHRGMKKLLGAVWNLTGKGQRPDEPMPQPQSNPYGNPAPNTGYGNTEELSPEQKDERAWQTCLAYNNRTYFEHYLRFFPNGRHAAEAQERIAKKKRTTAIVVTCAVVYIVVQILASILLNLDSF